MTWDCNGRPCITGQAGKAPPERPWSGATPFSQVLRTARKIRRMNATNAPVATFAVPFHGSGRRATSMATDASSYMSYASRPVDDLDYCGHIGLSGRPENKVEGLVRRFPRGGSSPLRRMKGPALRGLFSSQAATGRAEQRGVLAGQV